MLIAANQNFRSIGDNFTNSYSSASPVNSVSDNTHDSPQLENVDPQLHDTSQRHRPLYWR